jgi:hypothetical protein
MPTNQPTLAGHELWRPTRVEINLAHLVDNYRAIRQHVAPAAVMPILKANAYGHGLVEVARLMAALDAPYLGVAFVEEGILLREAGITTPILVLGGIGGKYWGGSVNQIPLFLEYNLTATVSSIEKLADIDWAARQAGTTAGVHLKIDTGMERIGTHYYNAPRLLEAALNSDHCRVTGIYSHFASSESIDLTSARIQLQRFNDVLEFYTQRGLPPPHPPHGQLRGHPPATREPLRLGPAGHHALRRLSGPGNTPDRPHPAGPELEIAGRLLQGCPAGPPGQLRRHLAERPPGAHRHHSGRLRRRLLPLPVQ